MTPLTTGGSLKGKFYTDFIIILVSGYQQQAWAEAAP
jgi:hypothetical protein